MAVNSEVCSTPIKKKDIVHGDDIDKKNGIYIFY